MPLRISLKDTPYTVSHLVLHGFNRKRERRSYDDELVLGNFFIPN